MPVALSPSRLGGEALTKAEERKPSMYRRIIVGYDGSTQAADALALGKLIADATEASLTLASVFQFDPLWGGRDPLLHDAAFQEAEADDAHKTEKAAASIGAKAEIVVSSSAARGLHDLAEETEADLVVVGSAHHGKAGQILAGSVGMSLLHGSPCSIAIAPHGYADQPPHSIPEIAVGFDGSPEAHMALTDAVDLARASGAPLRIVSVAVPPPIGYGKGIGMRQGWRELKVEIEHMMRERLDEAVRSVPDDVRVTATLAQGEADTALASIAAEDRGLLVLGSRAYGPLRRVLLGSVSTAVMRSAACPVIVHPRPAKANTTTPAPAKAGSA